MEAQNEQKSEKVKLMEIGTTPLNFPVITPFCISWSKDDKISVIVEGGVYVFELWPSPTSHQSTVSFLKSWIPVSTFVPLNNGFFDDKTFIWSYKRKQVYETALDPTLSHVIQKPSSSSSTSHVIQCEFSPLIQQQSYIACLTNNGVLEVYKNDFKKWLPIVDITQLWMSYCKGKIQSNIDFNYFKSKMFELKIVTMKWFEVPEIILVTCNENGTICVWDTNYVRTRLTMGVRHCFQVNGKPCSLELKPLVQAGLFLLFVGVASGQVICLFINLTTGSTNQIFNLWREDFLVPNLIKATYIRSKLFLLTVKHHILLIQNLSVSGEDRLEVLNTSWQEFPTIISGLNEFHNDFVITLQNHNVYTLIVKENSSFEIENLDIGLKAKHKTSYHCHGLAVSLNKAIWIFASSPKVIYDSLKEISNLIVYAPEMKRFKSLTDVTSSGLMEKIVQEFSSVRLSDILDLLELKKLELLGGISKFKDCYDTKASSTLLELKIMLWEVKLYTFCNSIETDSTLKRIERLIVQKLAENVVGRPKSPDAVSEPQKKQFDVCKALLTSENDRKEFPLEYCAICGEETIFEDVRTSLCSNSHIFPRCCLSLLPCDSFPYATCKNCNSVALLDFVSDESRCTYCDGLLISDVKVRVKNY